MGEYQRISSDRIDQAQANFAHAPFGMTAEMWTDMTPNSGARRGAHFVLCYYDVYAKPEEVVEEASILFGAKALEIEQHIREIAEMERAK